MSRRSLSLLVLTAVVVLAACSKSSPSPNAGSTTSASTSTATLPLACSLLTQAEAAQVLGDGAMLKQNPKGNECALETDSKAVLGSVTIAVRETKDWDATKAMMMKSDKSAKQLTGIGEDAFSVMNGVSILAKKGGVTIQVTSMINHAPMKGDQATLFVAQRAASRL